MNTPKPKPIDTRLIVRIADRAYARTSTLAIRRYTRAGCIRDLTMTHTGPCPLRLRDLLRAPDATFLADVLGIRRHLNRFTRTLEYDFRPHFAAHSKTTTGPHTPAV